MVWKAFRDHRNLQNIYQKTRNIVLIILNSLSLQPFPVYSPTADVSFQIFYSHSSSESTFGKVSFQVWSIKSHCGKNSIPVQIVDSFWCFLQMYYICKYSLTGLSYPWVMHAVWRQDCSIIWLCRCRCRGITNLPWHHKTFVRVGTEGLKKRTRRERRNSVLPQGSFLFSARPNEIVPTTINPLKLEGWGWLFFSLLHHSGRKHSK